MYSYVTILGPGYTLFQCPTPINLEFYAVMMPLGFPCTRLLEETSMLEFAIMQDL